MIDIVGGEQILTVSGKQQKYKVEKFKIDRTEVTVAAFRKCVAAKKCDPPVEDKDNANENCNYTYKNREEHPLTCVTWMDAKNYCAFVGARLPSKAEWIYAATGGRDIAYPWGDEKPAQGVCWSGAITNSVVGLTKTCPVGYANKDVSAAGVVDLAGNVQEWIDEDHVYVGGDYTTSHPDSMKVTQSNKRPGSWGYNFIGFRCAK